jgi:CRP-like cAMP-binding protein
VLPVRMHSTITRALVSNAKVNSLRYLLYVPNMFHLFAGIIDRWDNPERQSSKGWCSWCLRNETHWMFQKNTFTRDVFNCAACSKRTLPCRRCSGIAFAKGHAEWDDELCLVCDGSIPSWYSFLSEAMVVRKYCSFCSALCVHKLEDKCIVRASTYKCQGCRQLTVQCTSCDIGAVIKETAGSIVLDLAAKKAQCQSCISGIEWVEIARQAKKIIQIESDSSVRSRTNKECESLVALIHGSCSLQYARNSMLSEQGKPCSQVIIVEQGCCRAEVKLPSGKNLIVADDLEAGEVLGELGFLTKGISKTTIYIHSAEAKCSVVSNAAIMQSLQPGKRPSNQLRADIFFRYLAIKLVHRFQDTISGKKVHHKVSSISEPTTPVIDPAAERNQFVKTVFRLPSNERCIFVADSCCKMRHSQPVFGSVYLMDSFFGFHGNVFGFETTYIWALKSILDVQDLRDSIGFSILLSGNESDQTDHEEDAPIVIAGIVISVPEPKFRFDVFGSDLRNDFVGKFRELLAASNFNHFSVRGGDYVINDIRTIRLQKQKELEDFRKRQAAMSKFTNRNKQDKKESSGFFSMFTKSLESQRGTSVVAMEAPAPEDAESDECDDMDIDVIVDGVEITSYNRGDTILLQGSTERNLYQVARGSAQVEVQGKVVAVIGAGSTFGEISLILGSAANATVSAAVDNALIYSVDGKFIEKVLQRSRRVSASFFRFLSEIIARKIQAQKLSAGSSIATQKTN